MTTKTVLITARALADAKHVVYAGMRGTDGRNADADRIDVLIHNAGHMVLGPTEALIPEQVAAGR